MVEIVEIVEIVREIPPIFETKSLSKWGYQISKVLYIGQSSVLKSDVQYCLTYVSAALCFTEIGLNF